jgi:hypothetical protein
MKWTVGIITFSGHNKAGKIEQDDRIRRIVASARADIPEDCLEIIVVGDYDPSEQVRTEQHDLKIRVIPFDETVKPGWITRKKNIITEEASYDHVVYTHDYIAFRPGWYKGFLKFGDDWDVAMNVLINTDGTRYRDWCAWDAPEYGRPSYMVGQYFPFWPEGKYRDGGNYLPPYDYPYTNRMYISGAYWVAKQQFMKSCPLDERWTWGYSEDVEWSYRMREAAKYRMNTFSACQLIRPKGVVFESIDPYHSTNEYITKDLV